MRRAALLGLLALVVAAPAAGQQDTAQVRVLTDSLRIELVRARGFIRAAETQLSKTLSIADRIAALLRLPIGVPLPPAPPAPAVGTIPVLQLAVESASATHERVAWYVEVRDSLGAPAVGSITYSTDIGGLTPSMLATLTRQLLAGGVDDGAWYVPLGATATLTVEAGGVSESVEHTAGSPSSTPAPAPAPRPVNGVYTTDEANGTLGHFVTSGNGSNLGNSYIGVVDHPQYGRAIQVDFSGGPGVADINRAFQVEIPQPGVGYGGVIEFEGEFLVPRPQATLTTALRKLIYMQRPQNSRPIIINHEGTERMALHGPIGSYRVARTGNGVAPFEQWHRLRYIVKLNTGPMVPDGEVTVWLDGVQVWHFTGQPFLDTAAGFDTFKVGQQLQSSPIDKTLVYDERRYWRNVRLTLR